MRSAFLVSLALVLTLCSFSSSLVAWAGDGCKDERSVDCEDRAIQLKSSGVVDRSSQSSKSLAQVGSSRLGNSELVKAARLNKLGTFYRELGLYIKAEPLLRESIAIYSRVLGLDHPETRALLKSYAMPTPHDWTSENAMFVAAMRAARQRAARTK